MKPITRAIADTLAFISHEGGPKRNRTKPVRCAKHRDNGPDTCPGVEIQGHRVTDPHATTHSDHGHNGGQCKRGRPCREKLCRGCKSIEARVRRALKTAELGESDYYHRSTKYCQKCRARKRRAEEFLSDERSPDGLMWCCSRCYFEHYRPITQEDDPADWVLVDCRACQTRHYQRVNTTCMLARSTTPVKEPVR